MSAEEFDSEYARRRYQLIWQRKLPALLRDVATILDVPLESVRGLDRDHSAAVLAQFHHEYRLRSQQRKPALVQVVPADQRGDLLRICLDLADQVPSRDMILFWHCGGHPHGVQVPSNALLRNAVRQVGREHELLIASTEDAAYGLLANYEAEHYRPAYGAYELVVWGPDWLHALTDIPPSPLPFRP